MEETFTSTAIKTDRIFGDDEQVKKNSPRSLRHLSMNHLINRREGIPRLSTIIYYGIIQKSMKYGQD